MPNHDPVRTFAKKLRKEFPFNSEDLEPAANVYVAWIDMMGAGHLMSTSVQKTANCLVRLHMAVQHACDQASFQGSLLPINDGVYLVSPVKEEIMVVVQHTMAILASNFIAVERPHDRFLTRGAIAFGPVYSGADLRKGITLKKKREKQALLDRVLFGPPIIQAYKSEALAPPFGIAAHESARAFAPSGSETFRMTHWLWWQKTDAGTVPKNFAALSSLKDSLLGDLLAHFRWMQGSLVFHGVDYAKVDGWSKAVSQYLSLA